MMTRREFQETHGIIGQSVEMQEIIDLIQQVAPTDITVLITGESGVGKEVVAKAIHAASQRLRKAMVSVNCGAIPEGIIESELFGHEKGAFTGAGETRKGYFELADGGTIFLDEIGELPMGTQVKFLRVLENGEFMRVGSAVPRKVDVRVIAATNKDLETAVRRNKFRPDLYFRLRSINIHIPPLRSRPDDIPLFVDHFAREFSQRNNTAVPTFSPEAISVLKTYRWEGNVRELRNVIESILVLERGKVIRAEDVRRHLKDSPGHDHERNLPVHLNRTAEEAERELIYRALLEMKNDINQIKLHLAAQTGDIAGRAGRRADLSMSEFYDPYRTKPSREEREVEEATTVEEETMSLQEMERRMISDALKKFSGNRRKAAAALNISERTLYRKIKEYELNGR